MSVPPDQRDRQDDYRRQHPASATVARRLAEAARNIIFFGSITDDSVQHFCRLGRQWKAALTADPGVDEETGRPLFEPTVEQINALKNHGTVYSWGNQEQIGLVRIAEFRRIYDLAYPLITQAETEEEAASCLIDSLVIGNPHPKAWGRQFGRMKDEATSGRKAHIAEIYEGNPDTFDSQGCPVAAFCLGVAMDKGIRYPLAELLAKTPEAFRSGIGIWHGAGLLPDEWDLLGSLHA